MMHKNEPLQGAERVRDYFVNHYFYGLNECFAIEAESPQRSEDGAEDATGFAADSPTRRGTLKALSSFDNTTKQYIL